MISLLVGCCKPGTGFIGKPLPPVKHPLDIKQLDPKCEVDCLFVMDRKGLEAYVLNRKSDKLYHEAYAQRLDACNGIIAGD